MKKILVPTDFSNPAKLAVEVACEIARKANAEVVLLHVIEVPSTESFNVEGQIGQLNEWDDKLFTLKLIELAKKQMALLTKVAEEYNVKATCRIKIGNPFHGIRTTIAEQKADLIVMGTSGHSRLEEMIVGSNTEKVVRHSKCPVLTVHEKSDGINFKNIVYATSMNNSEKAFAEVVKNAQDMYGATVHLVRINTPMNFKPDTVVKPVMETFARKVGLKNYETHIFNDFSEEEGIIHFADSIKADLIAMATHGRTGFAHVLIGSIAEDVANHARKPVLTYVTNNNE
jgi:nucleotide-binding universal stress UspA family protein